MAFSSRDLALLLPDEVDALSMRHTAEAEQTATFQAPKPRVDHSKRVTRYFPGKAPDWVDPEENAFSKLRESSSSSSVSGGSKEQPQDKRLARLARASDAAASSGSGRRRYEAMVIEDGSDQPAAAAAPEVGAIFEPADSEDELEIAPPQPAEDDIEARRRRIKERLAAAERTEAPAAPAAESESEYETDSSDESSEDERVLMRPVFVPKFRRQTIAEKEAREEEESLKLAQAQLEAEERKRATHALVAESTRRLDEADSLALQAATDVDSDAGLPDDADGEDEEEEYQEWKLREMARIRRDAEARIEDVLEKAELERRRGMTADERYAEDLKNGRFDKKAKAKWGYLQKYYHKGVFYMDDNSVKDNDVRKKDFSAPTLEDKFNKEALPAVLQVKNFGKRGRTKYTHLLDQDTTQSSAPTVYQEKIYNHSSVVDSYMQKRGGVGDIEKPFVKKPRKV